MVVALWCRSDGMDAVASAEGHGGVFKEAVRDSRRVGEEGDPRRSCR